MSELPILRHVVVHDGMAHLYVICVGCHPDLDTLPTEPIAGLDPRRVLLVHAQCYEHGLEARERMAALREGRAL